VPPTAPKKPKQPKNAASAVLNRRPSLSKKPGDEAPEKATQADPETEKRIAELLAQAEKSRRTKSRSRSPSKSRPASGPVPHRDSVSTRDRSRYGGDARAVLCVATAATSSVMLMLSFQGQNMRRPIRSFPGQVFLLWPTIFLPVCQVAVPFAEPVSPAAVEALLFALPHLAQEVPLQITVRHWGGLGIICI
jgi:hypothetical protein